MQGPSESASGVARAESMPLSPAMSASHSANSEPQFGAPPDGGEAGSGGSVEVPGAGWNRPPMPKPGAMIARRSLGSIVAAVGGVAAGSAASAEARRLEERTPR